MSYLAAVFRIELPFCTSVIAASIASGFHCLLHLNFVTFGMLSVAQCCFFVGTFLINTGIDTEELQLVITNVTSTVYTVARKTTDR